MSAPSVLHLSNEPSLQAGPRFSRAFAGFEASGSLRCTVVSPRALLAEGATPEEAFARTVSAAREAAPDLVFVQTPGPFPWNDERVRALLHATGSPPVVFWDGDAWGGRKALPGSALAWLRRADQVFTVAAGQQAELFRSVSRGHVRYVPHVLPPAVDPPDGAAPADAGRTPANRADAVDAGTTDRPDVAVVGNRYLRFGVLERVAGSRDRARLVRGLQRIPGIRTAVYGHGWRGPGARGPLPFAAQLSALGRARITAGWDHYNRHHGYFSDRLPIALCAGRAHVTSRQPGMDWLPGPDHGLYLADTPAAAVSVVESLLTEEPAELDSAAARGAAWVRERLTDREALCHMLGGYVPLPAPPADPWARFA
ncbi:hypothetical protein [Streptomyces sp. NPDC005181]|uniref:glycosyltransferase family protein n=1 Tax=Streptomyces sp. NPDC005181 TaxID=3156869 RepID=UPI0033AB4542